MKKENNNIAGRPLRVMVSGGGTGGHIFPALSIAAAVRRRYPDADILFVGADNRMEMERVPAAGYPIVGLPVSGFDRSNPLRNFKVLYRVFRSVMKAHKLVKNFRPDVAIGVGGYASGPTLKAAQWAGVPTLLQEQNSYAGVTNRFLAKGARRICVAYPDMQRFFPADKIVMTGNPVRADLTANTMTPEEAKKALGFDPEKPLVAVVGGSLGARTLNDAMIANALDGAVEAAGFQLLWQTGKRDAERCLAAVEAKKPDGVQASAFLSDMGAVYKAADLIVARAGAGTISELQILGKPVILVPSPNVAEDHQRKNALALADRDAALMVADADAAEMLWTAINALIGDKERLAELSANISKMALRNSDEKIVDEIEKILK